MAGKGSVPASITEKFAKYARPDPATGCIEWTGKISDGYGRIYLVGGVYAMAHRVSYEVQHGPIPTGLQLDHLCRNRRCVNPDHLEPVTSRDNTLRGAGVAALNAVKTHCWRGHEFTAENTIVRQDGRRQCRTCSRKPLDAVPGAGTATEGISQ